MKTLNDFFMNANFPFFAITMMTTLIICGILYMAKVSK